MANLSVKSRENQGEWFKFAIISVQAPHGLLLTAANEPIGEYFAPLEPLDPAIGSKRCFDTRSGHGLRLDGTWM